jgi:hypothetical protein
VAEGERRRPGSRGKGDRPPITGRSARPRHRFHLSQQLVAGQASVPQPALRVQDPQLRRAPRRPEAILRDAHLHPLPDDLPPELHPRPPAQLQPQRRHLGQGAGQTIGQTGRLQHHQPDAGLSDQCRQPVQALAQHRRRGPARLSRGQVQQKQIHGPVLQQQSRHRQGFLDRSRRQDHQPVQPDSLSRRLDRVQAPAQIQAGGYAARRLGLGDGPQGQCRLAAAGAATDSRGRGARQAAQSQDRIECPKAGGYGQLARPCAPLDSLVRRQRRHRQ